MASIVNSNFIDNIATSVNHGITLINSQIYIYGSLINYTQSDFLTSTNQVDSGFFNLNYQSKIEISNSTITNCRGAMSAVLYLTGQSIARIFNHTLISQCQSNEGDTIMSTLARSLEIDQVTFFNNN